MKVQESGWKYPLHASLDSDAVLALSGAAPYLTPTRGTHVNYDKITVSMGTM